MEWFTSLDRVWQALAATVFTWAVTAFGAARVFLFKDVDKRILNAMLSVASGIMIAASFWSLLLPAEQMCGEMGLNASLHLCAGFLSGGLVIFLCDKLLPVTDESRAKRSAMLVFSITLHNIPEGLCIGVAFGSRAYSADPSATASACLLALGIGLQNFPEGAAVSIPLRREGYSGKRAFFWGQISGAVEPIAGIFGALLVIYVRALLPFCLSFAAGAMIYVVAAELLPEAVKDGSGNTTALFSLLGFSLMMLLDTVF